MTLSKGLIVAILILPILAMGQGNCPNGSPGTTVFFVNGLEYSPTGAVQSLTTLNEQLTAQLHAGSLRASECMSYRWLINPTNNFLHDLWTAAKQSGVGDIVLFQQILSGDAAAPAPFLNAIEQLNWSQTDASVLATHIQHYEQELHNGNTVISVSHSQGNFYTNEAYFKLISDGVTLPNPQLFNEVSVATPTNETEGGATYTTLCSDFIWRVPLALSWNVTNDSLVCNSLLPGHDPSTLWQFWQHDFVQYYLAPKSDSQLTIINNIEAAIPIRAPGFGNLVVQATLNGQPWPGTGESPLSYLVTGPQSVIIGQAIPGVSTSVPRGQYTLSSVSGGPARSVLTSIAPSTSAFLADGQTLVFTINFATPAIGTVSVLATLDNNTPFSSGSTSDLAISYFITGGPNSQAIPGTTGVPFNSGNTILPGSYTLVYSSGAPANSTLSGIICSGAVTGNVVTTKALHSEALVAHPSCTAQLVAGQTLTFTLQFQSNPPSAGFTMSSGSQSATDGQTLNLSVAPGGTNVSFNANFGASITGWQWTIDGSVVAIKPVFSQSFPTGPHSVSLIVTDNRGTQSQPAQATIFVSGSLSIARAFHQATLLNSGLVLITGGETPNGTTNTAEIYDPKSGLWRATQQPTLGGAPLLMTAARSYHTATLLNDGRVLIAGGSGSLISAEIFDPATETFVQVAPMNHRRGSHRAVGLTNGGVLVIGGYDGSPNAITDTAEIYTPSTNSWQLTPPLPQGGTVELAATLLLDGRALATGCGLCRNPERIEVYDPIVNAWQSLTNMLYPRQTHTATTLPNGKVLIAGGNDGANPNNTAEVYDVSGSGQSVLAGIVSIGGWRNTATLLNSSTVVLAGGYNYLANPYNECCEESVNTVQNYDPSSGLISTVQPMASARGGATATLLQSGQVLMVGGTGYSFVQPMNGLSGTLFLNSVDVIAP